ncbi:HprK-related kinase A [Pelagibius sp. Alg239-R121]|uniref:HprK-related kinase A n=1 Tax=Pelagibius sp. Alg239-R121 TaxID=2993448 RepID=UPI0024A62A08|nr:HprK-related kinase A [Pelagibius sp. Alg239-R121]
MRGLRRGTLKFKVGPFVARIGTTYPLLQQDFLDIYEGYPLAAPEDFVHFNLKVGPVSLLRRWFRPKVIADGGFVASPFVPLPGDLAILALEMGLNWQVGTKSDQFLIFHSGVVAKDFEPSATGEVRPSRAVLMAGQSGAGKSTLTAGLAYNGWRLFSDEFALMDTSDLQLYPYPRPISLKNQSIEVMVERLGEEVFSRPYLDTPKGTIRYLKAPGDSLRNGDRPARLDLVVFPEYSPGAPAQVAEFEGAEAFAMLRGASVNCDRLGQAAFDAISDLTGRCKFFHLQYDTLDMAMRMVEDLMEEAA